MDAVAEELFYFVFSPPGPIHGPVAGGTPGVEGKMSRVAVPVADKGGAVKIGIVGSKARMRIRCFLEEGSAGICRRCPEKAVRFRSPPRPKLIKSRQVIGRVRKIERHHKIFFS